MIYYIIILFLRKLIVEVSKNGHSENVHFSDLEE